MATATDRTHRGLPVEPDSLQLKIYGLPAAQKYGCPPEDGVNLHIIQPRRMHTSGPHRTHHLRTGAMDRLLPSSGRPWKPPKTRPHLAWAENGAGSARHAKVAPRRVHAPGQPEGSAMLSSCVIISPRGGTAIRHHCVRPGSTDLQPLPRHPDMTAPQRHIYAGVCPFATSSH
jgi:hypothetical protein